MKRILVILTVWLLLTPVIGSTAEIKFGLLPRLPEKQLLEMFIPLAQYLEKETAAKVTLIIPKDFDTYTKQAIAGDFDIGFTNPNIYILIKKEVPQIEPLALASEPGVGTKLKGVFFVVKESPIKTIKELKGKKVSFVDPGSAAGFVAQMLALQKAGIRKEDLSISFAGKPPKVGEAVRDGKADAGGMPESVFKKLPFEFMLKEIGKTIDLPNWPVHTTKKTDKKVASKVRDAFLKLKPNSAQAEKALDKANLEGFVATSDKDFDPMREAAKAAGTF
ncbi:MAG: phosphate/phosphite/phosphonate ABC transporter substrate-binding protein [Deltaproteobacteria bacterium]|nr:phosphate/phosphite/phosphonate ABC transporter substrate-binding protein [Deltaproteobacteria bacterium]